MTVFVAEAMPIAAAAIAKAASNTSKVMEAACKVLEHPGNMVHASPAESLAIGPRTAKQTLQRVSPPMS